MKSKKARFLLILSALIILTIIGSIVFYANIEANLEKLRVQKVTDINLSMMSDGAYTGSFKAFPIEAVVNVIIENHRIKQIDLLKHKHGQGSAAEVITSKIIEAQSLNVDMISGASYSSKVILKAIENALTDAKEGNK